jgi:rSAM/selenodomain-associated transferase 1
MPRPTTLIIVFAKAPRAGRVKTRLFPLLGAEGALRLHKRLVQRALATACASACATVELHCPPPASHRWLRALARHHGVGVRAQHGQDVGERMLAAFTQGLRRHRRVILIGSDCPALRVRDLRRAVRLLASNDAVLAPAEDGGYPLLGLARGSPRLFRGLPWGGDQVLAQTRGHLRGLGWRWRELRTLWDVDRPADALRLAASGLLARRP